MIDNGFAGKRGIGTRRIIGNCAKTRSSPNTALHVNNFIGRLLLPLTPPAKLRGDAGWTVHVLRRREARPVRSSLRGKFSNNLRLRRQRTESKENSPSSCMHNQYRIYCGLCFLSDLLLLHIKRLALSYPIGVTLLCSEIGLYNLPSRFDREGVQSCNIVVCGGV